MNLATLEDPLGRIFKSGANIAFFADFKAKNYTISFEINDLRADRMTMQKAIFAYISMMPLLGYALV